MPIRIRFECTRFPHWGAQSGYTQLIRHLDPQRHQTVLYAAADTDEDLAPWLAPFQQWLRLWIRHGRMPWYKLSDLNAEAEAFESCRAGEVDIVHFLDGEHSGQFLPRLINQTRSSNLRTVATFHQPPEVIRELVNVDLLRWFDSVVLVSPSQLPFFKQYVLESRLHVFLHGVNAKFFCPAAAPKPSDRLRCITTGHWLRDWDIFRKVAHRMNDVTFIAVTSSTIRFDELPNVEVYSGISDAALADLYRSADILFLPLIGSTANNALLEGIASGLPVVATDLEAVRAYLPNGAAILVAGNRADSFVDALRQLQQDVELRREKGRQARARAEALDWTRAVRPYEKLYADLMAAAPSNEVNQPRPVVGMRASMRGEGGRDAGAINLFTDTDLLSSVTSRKQLAEIDGWGYSLFDAGLVDEAYALFATLIAAVPDDHRGYAGLARLAERQWRWGEAIEHWDKCLAITRDEDRAQAIAGKARCLVQTGRVGEARDLFWRIADQYDGLEGLAQIAALEGPPSLAHQSWEECTARFPDRIEGFLGHAALLLEQASYTEADALLNHAVGIWPESAAVGALWAWSATVAKDRNAAAVRWKSILGKFANRRDVCAGYARYLATVGDRATADAYLTTLANDPVSIAEFRLEYSLVREDWNAAIEQADRLIALENHKPWHRLRQAVMLMRLPSASQEAVKAALAILQELYAHSPESVLIKAHLIEAYIRAGSESEAESVLQTIPAEDKAVQLEIFRAWSLHHANGNSAGEEHWKAIFLFFGLLHAGDQLVCGHLFQSSP